MAHFHEDSETYYLDQLCLVALSGAFGVVCLTLYFWQVPMLDLMLGKQFHAFVLASGVLLLGMTGIRAVILWKSAGRKTSSLPLVHDHGHGPHEHHDHEHCAHDHNHEHGHEHAHGDHHHDHSHGHNHDHAHDGHDHDWAPWRYVVLLLPIMLFLLGLPNKGPSVQAASIPVDLTQESIGYSTLIAAGDPIQQLVLATVLNADSSALAEPIRFLTLKNVAGDNDNRDDWDGKWVTVKGQFAPNRQHDHQFTLVRFKIRCCGADAVPLNVPMVCKERLQGLKQGEWVNVTGRIRFQKSGDSFITVLRVPNLQAIAPTGPEPGFYLE